MKTVRGTEFTGATQIAVTGGYGCLALRNYNPN